MQLIKPLALPFQVESPGLRPRRRLLSFNAKKKEAKKRAPLDLPFGFPALRGRFEDGQKLAVAQTVCPSFSQNTLFAPAASQGEEYPLTLNIIL
jgi:hypothetical protein